MNKKLIMQFIKDHWFYSLIYFIAVICIILFYRFTTASRIEIIYPLLIGFYIYLIMLLVMSIKYFGFQKRLSKSITNPEYDLKPLTEQQKEINAVIKAIHQSYIRQLHTLNVNNETQKRFLSQWIHNLKTPIAVIDLTTQKEINELNEARAALQSISEENDKLHHNVEQLLSLIRLENFAKDYVPEKLDLKGEIKQVINGFKNQFVINHVFPELDIRSGETVVFSDRKWHRLMLEQFVSNAVKYSRSLEDNPAAEDKPVKKVWITLTKEDNGLCLTVRDEGIGIPEYDLYRIFEPFFTGDNGREVRNATGIGLYIADMAAKKLGHRIEVKSQKGEGTTVLIHYTFKEPKLTKL